MHTTLDAAQQKLLNTPLNGKKDWGADKGCLLALGYAHLDWTKGNRFFQQIFSGQKPDGSFVNHLPNPLPIFGFVLAGLYELAPDEKAANDLLAEVYPKILQYHRYLYNHRDPAEEGLVVIEDVEECLYPEFLLKEGLSKVGPIAVQDPLYNACLIWSNECLLEIGEHLGKDLLELLQWNELSIFSFNDKLWDETAGLYRPYDLQEESWLTETSLLGLFPLIAEIPDQDQAERLLEHLKDKNFQGIFNQIEISLLSNWFLYHGLWRFGMSAKANKIQQESLKIMESVDLETLAPWAIALWISWLSD